MSGQPSGFDFAAVIPIEGGAPLTPPYSIIEVGDTLKLRSYFHCNSPDGVVRNSVARALDVAGGATVTVRYYFEDLEVQAIIAPPTAEPGGAFAKMNAAEVAAAFAPGGDLAGSGLDPTDDYYRSNDTANINTAGGGAKLAPTGGAPNSGTWRILTVLHGVNGADKVSAFDDSLVIHVQG